MLSDMEFPFASIRSIWVHNSENVLKLIFEKKLACDNRYNEVVSYTEEKEHPIKNVQKYYKNVQYYKK